MSDREKVLIGLEHCSRGVIGCNDCIYRKDFGCRAQLAADALELLKEQEKPKRESKAMLPCKCGGTRREHWYSSAKGAGLRCKKCGFEVWGKDDTDVIRKWNEEINNLSREERL